MTTIQLPELIKTLEENICVITFTKINGEKREMPCTLRAEIVPPTTIVEGKEPKKKNPDVVSVWCLDKKEWRSFRFANLIDVKIQDA